jgi:NADPH:quinone reductase-like Zn-dependent oxidoreductase
MRAVRVHEVRGPEVLRVNDLEVPDPGPGEIRVRIEPSALVEPPPKLIEAMTNDPKDRHVLATAVAGG